NVGKSRPLRLRIISPEELDRQMKDRQRAIREEIDRILAMQKQALTGVEEALRIIQKTDKLDKPQRDDLKNDEMIQRQADSRITSKADGLDEKIGKFLEDLDAFKINNPDIQAQMERMKQGTERIRDQHLGPAEQGLNRASKALDDQAAAKPDAAPVRNE